MMFPVLVHLANFSRCGERGNCVNHLRIFFGKLHISSQILRIKNIIIWSKMLENTRQVLSGSPVNNTVTNDLHFAGREDVPSKTGYVTGSKIGSDGKKPVKKPQWTHTSSFCIALISLFFNAEERSASK